MKAYNTSVNYLKALGISLMVLGHTRVNPQVIAFIYMFHMPLFFIISGYLWNTQKIANIPFDNFAKKIFKNYIIPYFKICAVCFVLFKLPLGIWKYGVSMDLVYYYSKYLWGAMVYSRGTVEWLPNCSPVWFLTCLFCAEVIFYFIMKSRKPYIYVVIVGFLGYITSSIGKYFPWNIDNAFSAVPLLYIGVLIRQYWDYISSKWNLLIMLPLAVAIVVYGIKGVDFDGNHYENMMAMYLQSTLITLAILVLFHSYVKPNGGGYFLFIRQRFFHGENRFKISFF